MSDEDKKVTKIDDPRLSTYTKRLRSGREQVFYTGNDERDFKRYQSDSGNKNHGVEMHDKPDTIRLQPPEKHYYANLIDGVWWWVNGCSECNGNPRDWMTYVECDKHNICRSCGCSRQELTEAPWGGKNGWICKPCNNIEHQIAKEQALSSMPSDEDFREYDYHGLYEIKCPYCDCEVSDSFEHSQDDDEDHECPRCDKIFTVTAVHQLTFDCTRIDESDVRKDKT